MMYLKQYFLWLTIVATLFVVGCAGGESAPSESDLQATVDAAVEATTESLNAPTFTPIPTVADAISETETESDDSADVSDGNTAEEAVEPPTQTPVPTVTNTPEPSPTPTPSDPFIRSELDDGSARYELPVEGFGITLPADWLVANLTESAEGTDQAELEAILGSALFRNLVESGIKFYALNWSEASRGSVSPANINMAAKPASGANSIDELGSAAIEQLAYELDLFADEIGQSTTSIGDLPAFRIDYFWEIRTPTGDSVELQIVQYLVTTNGTDYTITVTLPAELAPTLLPDAESAIQGMNFYAAGE